MGENFLEEQVKNFERRRNIAREEVKRRTLFERPEITETEYTIRFEDGVKPKEGESYFAVVSRHGERVDVAQGPRVVGRIEDDGAEHLSKGLREPGDPGVVTIRIREFSPLSGCGKGVIVEG